MEEPVTTPSDAERTRLWERLYDLGESEQGNGDDDFVIVYKNEGALFTLVSEEVARERAECAEIADEFVATSTDPRGEYAGKHIATVIRSRARSTPAESGEEEKHEG